MKSNVSDYLRENFLYVRVYELKTVADCSR